MADNANVTGKLPIFQPIIDFIVLGIGDDPVKIIGNEEVYALISKMSDMGSHTLLSYIEKDGLANILVNLRKKNKRRLL